jgi:hypothetical protein
MNDSNCSNRFARLFLLIVFSFTMFFLFLPQDHHFAPEGEPDLTVRIPDVEMIGTNHLAAGKHFSHLVVSISFFFPLLARCPQKTQSSRLGSFIPLFMKKLLLIPIKFTSDYVI